MQKIKHGLLSRYSATGCFCGGGNLYPTDVDQRRSPKAGKKNSYGKAGRLWIDRINDHIWRNQVCGLISA